MLLLFLSVGSYLAYELASRRRRQLADQENRRLFTHRLLTTQEGERKRIAHELHDSIGQHLVLSRTLAMLPPSPSTSHTGGHLVSIAEQAAVTLKEVETISYDLRPYQLDRLGLTKAVLSLVRSLERSSTVRVECSIDNIDHFFPKEIEINFYRIVLPVLLPEVLNLRGIRRHGTTCVYCKEHGVYPRNDWGISLMCGKLRAC